MAEVTKVRTGFLLRRLFEVLLEHPEGLKAQRALEALANRVEMTPHEAGTYDSGERRFEKIVRFATVDSVKAGWMVKQKGTWFVTEEGRAAFARYQDPTLFYGEAVRLYWVWKRSQVKEDEPDGLVPEEVGRETSITFEQAEEMAWEEIQSYLRAMPPYDFQELVASLLRAMGYHIGWVAPPGKDGGVDVVAWSDPLGTRVPRIKAQVKRYSTTIPVSDVRSFMAMLGDDDAGIFVTTSSFTKDAQDEVRALQSRRLTLIDLEKFVELWIEFYPNLEDVARQRLALSPIYFLTPEP